MAMFVSGSKHRALEVQLFVKALELSALQEKHNAQVEKWNALVAEVNRKGGQAFLDFGVRIDQMPAAQFTADELKTLLQLCHPDKHDGKESAVRITQKLLELR
jgi:histidinol dehydrogenase